VVGSRCSFGNQVVDDRQILSGLYLFRDVTPSALLHLCQLAPPIQFGAGAKVFKQGESADSALLVVEGRLIASVVGSDGEKIVGDSRAGEMVGETALFAKDMLRGATVIAAEPSRCLVIDRTLIGRTESGEAIAAIERHLLGTMARRIRKTNQTMQMVWKEMAPKEPTEPLDVPTIRERLANLLRGRL
jgi:CRP-like cAMP-binding protein